MEHLQYAVPTLFGLEGLCADEMRRLGLDRGDPQGAECPAAVGNICIWQAVHQIAEYQRNGFP